MKKLIKPTKSRQTNVEGYTNENATANSFLGAVISVTGICQDSCQ